MKRRRLGLTLIELLVVGGILVLIVGVMLPTIVYQREAARRAQCKNNCKRIGLALANYENALNVFPPAHVLGTNNKACAPTSPGNNDCNWQRAPWTVLLVPYMEDECLYNMFNHTLPFLGRCDYSNFSYARINGHNVNYSTGTLPPAARRRASLNVNGYNVNFLMGSVGFGQWSDSDEVFRCPSNPNFNTDRYINCYYCCMGGGPGPAKPGLTGDASPYRLPALNQVSEDDPEKIDPLSACFISHAEQVCCPQPTRGPGNASVRVAWNNGIMHLNSSIGLKSIADGTSNTVIAGETMYVGLIRNYCGSTGPGTNQWGTPSAANWLWSSSTRNHATNIVLFNTAATWSPINAPFMDFTWAEALSRQGATGHGQIMAGYSSWHTGGANHIFADDSVRFLSQGVDLSLYQTLGARADGLAVSASEL